MEILVIAILGMFGFLGNELNKTTTINESLYEENILLKEEMCKLEGCVSAFTAQDDVERAVEEAMSN